MPQERLDLRYHGYANVPVFNGKVAMVHVRVGLVVYFSHAVFPDLVGSMYRFRAVNPWVFFFLMVGLVYALRIGNREIVASNDPINRAGLYRFRSNGSFFDPKEDLDAVNDLDQGNSGTRD